MLTDRQIQDLIEHPKRITSKTPSEGYVEENGSWRCSLELEAIPSNGAKFRVFTRQNIEFMENFSIGLRYQTGDKALGMIVLVRYNGPHGESSRQPDGHYATPHTHHMTAAELASGSSQPQERRRKITDRYNTFEEALGVFFEDVAIMNYAEHFPEWLQSEFFYGRQ